MLYSSSSSESNSFLIDGNNKGINNNKLNAPTIIKGESTLTLSNNNPPIFAIINIPIAPNKQEIPITDPLISQLQLLFTITYPTVINP